jgi:N-methylhydantoinase B
MADIGGCLSASPHEVYEEGLIIPPLKAAEGGRENETFFKMLEANVRVPRQVCSDVRALMAGCHVMEGKLGEYLSEHGLPDLDGIGGAVLERSEAIMRKAIAETIPNGVYEGETTVDGFDEPLTIRAQVTVADGQVGIDFAGSSPQSRQGINCTYVYTHVWATYTMKCLAAPRLPNNDGTFAPIRVAAPEGSFLNPLFPAPVKMKPSSGHYVPIAILNALAEVVPRRMLAESGNKFLVYVAGNAGGKAFSDLMFVMGGMGARATRDGLNCISFPANSSNLPVEVMENALPLRVHHKALRPDSGGAGRFRGGLGQEVELEAVAPEALTIRAEHGKLKTPPRGFRGGSDGAPGGVYVNGKPIPDKLPVILCQGDRMRLVTPGSGGMYAPAERCRSAIERDVEEGVVTAEAAARDYGIPPGTAAGRHNAEG